MSVYVHMDGHGDIAEEAKALDWGALVVEHQGGVEVFVVGLPAKDAAELLRSAADALEAKS